MRPQSDFLPRRWSLMAGVVLGLLMMSAVSSGAQLLGPEYRLSPGDVLQVQVFGEQQMSGEYTVGPAGTISIPQMGQIYVRDTTLKDIEKVLTERLSELLRFPHVLVTINETASTRKVYVSGQVEKQGPLLLPFGATVVDALAGAGIGDFSDISRVRVTHPGQSPTTLDFSGLRTDEPIDISERVQYGDIIYVPKVQDKIAVLGQVNQPGSVYVPIGEEVTVLEALSRIGQGLSARADRSAALLIRKDSTTISIDLNKLLEEGDITQNKLLQAGDVLVVHEAANISVVGEVTNPTTFLSGEPVTVLQAISQAGGFTREAALTQGQVFTHAGEARPVDLEALWKEGDLTQNVLMYPGDILVVPEAEPETLMVVGAVARPGPLDIAQQEERDVLRIVTVAGVTATADLRRVTIYREGDQIVANLQAVMDEGKLEQNVDVEPGDVIMVPEKETLYVLGAVGRQGKLAWEPGMSIVDVLTAVGGLAARAQKNNIAVVRTRPDGTWESIKLSVGPLAQGIPPEPHELKAGDIVYVPPRGVKRNILTLIRDALWTVGAVINILE